MNLRGGRFGPSTSTVPTDLKHRSRISRFRRTSKTHILIAGGAGFIGANLCRAYLDRGVKVTCIDNLSTGRLQNIKRLEKFDDFEFKQVDVCERQALFSFVRNRSFDYIINLASPASPPKYNKLGLETLMVGSVGVKNLLDIALRDGARFIHASTSEVYGDPKIPVQNESYWGNVNPYGPRSRYDESKRFAEALIYQYRENYKLSTGIVRIFNTYGPYMDPEDGRVISNFVTQALRGEPVTIYGDGSQTRSFGYIDDLVDGLIKLVGSSVEGPVNMGNPVEYTVKEVATIIIRATESKSKIVYKPLPQDDPMQRRPDITLAKKHLGWQPKVNFENGLSKTIEYFRYEILPYQPTELEHVENKVLQAAQTS